MEKRRRKFVTEDFDQERALQRAEGEELFHRDDEKALVPTCSAWHLAETNNIDKKNKKLPDPRIIHFLVALYDLVEDKAIDEELVAKLVSSTGFDVEVSTAFKEYNLFKEYKTRSDISLSVKQGIIQIKEDIKQILQFGNRIPITIRNGTNSGDRLESDFEIVEIIGKGGFGVVYKARHRIDGGVYAIKEVTLVDTDSARISRATREVEVATKFSHPNVVRYHTSWQSFDVEIPKLPVRRRITETESLPHITELTSDGDTWAGDEEWSDSSSNDSERDMGAYDKSYEKAMVPVVDTEVSYTSDKEDVFAENRPIFIPQYKLFIQMSFCDHSLRDYMDQRNASVLELDRTQKDVNLKMEFQATKDLLAGIAYLHKSGFIHRDIKPENILFNKTDDKWQICDFGLARLHQPKQTSSSISVFTNSPYVNLSSGVGTLHYAAPEQRNSSSYSFPVDIFAAGYVIFELFYVMSGLSERIRVFEQIRSKDEHRLPTEFHTKLGSIVGFDMANQIASTVESCIQIESTKRPTAAEILHEGGFDSDTISDKDKLIAELREENARLHRLVATQKLEIEKLKLIQLSQ